MGLMRNVVTRLGFRAPNKKTFAGRTYTLALRPDARNFRERPAGFKTKQSALAAAARLRRESGGDPARVFKVAPGKYVVYRRPQGAPRRF